MYTGFLKRTVDLLISLSAIIILFPILIPIILILILTGEHQVFYLQKRVGYKNSEFKIFKFATMLKNSVNMATGSLTIRNDPRILPMGKFLRKTKINELPQFINVVKGDMSVVGPRPQMKIDFLKYPKSVQEKLYNIKPGITCVQQLIFRDEEKWISECNGDKHEFYKSHIAPYKGELEIWYQNNLSAITDLKIIFLTCWVILFSNSNLPYKLLNDLPNKPKTLT